MDSVLTSINTYSVHKAEKIIRKDIEKKEVQGLTPEQLPLTGIQVETSLETLLFVTFQ